MAKMQADRMKQQYLLSNDQYDKVYKLCLEQAKTQQARMEQMKAEQEQMSAKMKGILNETQYERYEQVQQHKGMPFGNGPQGACEQGAPDRGPQQFGKGPQVRPEDGRRNNMQADVKGRPMTDKKVMEKADKAAEEKK